MVRPQSGCDGPAQTFRRSFRDFRFLALGTRLNAISEISAIAGRRRLVRRADFGEFNTQKLILCELLENVHAGRGGKM
jgi:hypothetical protein